jgi:superfamily II DNA/RNA helicase
MFQRTFKRPSHHGGSNNNKNRPAHGGHSRPATGGGFRSAGSGPRRGPSGGGFRGGGNRGGGGRNFSQRIDINKFINKSVITEEVAVFKPEHQFTDFKIDDRLKSNILKKGYTAPTPIQDRAIPHVLQGSDIVGIANTGTGKTAAFLIPLIDKALKNPSESVLIVVPTRELAIQIDQEFRGFTPGLKMFSVVCVGGTGLGKQLQDLRYHNDFVIGTPGRLKDLIERKSLDLSKFKTVVLDEADRMLDMGFIHDMKYMMAKMPKEKHTLFFSATMSREIEILIKDFLRNPVSISVKTRDTAQSVHQDIVRVPREKNKIDVLHDLLITNDFSKVLIFGKTKHGVEKLSKELIHRGFKAESIHGNKTQGKRQTALTLFKAGKVQVLVATDVAARGIDVSDVSHVINYDIPATYDDYVHRIGRTGRGGKKGKALTFVE